MIYLNILNIPLPDMTGPFFMGVTLDCGGNVRTFTMTLTTDAGTVTKSYSSDDGSLEQFMREANQVVLERDEKPAEPTIVDGDKP